MVDRLDLSGEGKEQIKTFIHFVREKGSRRKWE